MKTKIIAIEGIDGSGKTVQIELLQKKLLERGYSVSIRSYPVYSSFFGSQVGLLLSGSGGIKATDVDQKSMAMWFALDRFDDFKSFVDGDADFLLINRYVLSNAVYQSIRDGDWDKPDIVDWVFETFLDFNIELDSFSLFIQYTSLQVNMFNKIGGGDSYIFTMFKYIIF